MGKRKDGTWTLTDPGRLESLSSPVRQDIVDTLVAGGGMTVRELAAQLGHRPSGLYYHLEALESVGLVERRARRREDGREERVCSVPATRVELDYRSEDPRNRAAVIRAVRAILRLTGRDFERGFSHPRAVTSGAGRTLWGARGKAWLTGGEIERANALLRELSDLFRRGEPGDGRTLCAVTWVLAPIEDRSALHADPDSPG